MGGKEAYEFQADRPHLIISPVDTHTQPVVWRPAPAPRQVVDELDNRLETDLSFFLAACCEKS